MEPILKVGGILYYKEIDKNDYKINDIVVFKSTKYLISHRIVEITNDGFITKGDANKNIDSNKVQFNKALGIGTNWSIPYIGYYADFIYKNKWILLIVLIILIINSKLSNYVVEDNEDNI
jgi:signal peptidase